jgi:hypothetical protein
MLQTVQRLGGFGLMLHETTTDITAVAEESERQVVQFKRLQDSADLMVQANRKIDISSGAVQETTRAGQAELSDCRSAMTEAIKCMSLMVNTTEDIERRLSEVEKALAEVTGVSSAIETVAKQTNLLALNATIEASRAGNAGRGAKKRRAVIVKLLKLHSLIADYREKQFALLGPEDEHAPLFPSQRGSHMTAASMTGFMTGLYRKAGIPSGSSRSGRRTLVSASLKDPQIP